MAETTKLDLDLKVKRSVQVYDTSFLNGYDIWVHGFCNKYAWKCPTERLIEQYRDLTSRNHLEVGVGTGFLLDKASLDPAERRIGIMDFSRNCLDYSSRRLKRYDPELYHHDILKAFPENYARKFDSIGINYVLHCVPGDFSSKGEAFGNLKSLLSPGGVLFGSTLLGAGVKRTAIACALMWGYSKFDIFSNNADSEYALRKSLSQHFKDVRIETVGCCALFEARQ